MLEIGIRAKQNIICSKAQKCEKKKNSISIELQEVQDDGVEGTYEELGRDGTGEVVGACSCRTLVLS